MRKFSVAIFVGTVLVLAACGGTGTATTQPTASRLDAAEIAAAVNAAMDTTADPCRDFYRYACGGWLDATEIPADQARWTRMSEIRERNRERLRDLLEAHAQDPAADPETAKLGWFYGSCMNEEAINALGSAPIEPWLGRIDEVGDEASFMATVGELMIQGVDPLFDAQIEGDLKNPDVNIAHFFQGGLSLPDRDYYLNDDERSVGLREAFVVHVSNMLTLLGESEDDARAHAEAILAFETRLAEVSLPREDLRDPYKTYHKIDVAGLEKLSPDLSWDAFFGAVDQADLVDLNVGTPDFFEGLGEIVNGSEMATLREYLRWHLLTSTAPTLSAEFVHEDFEFFGKTLTGREELPPRWKRCVTATDRAMGELLGKAFVEKYFAGDSKEKAREMIVDIEEAFEGGLPELAWMDDTTRERAAEKMTMLENRIGYPDKWRDYSTMEVRDQPYFDNSLAATRFEVRRQLAKIGNPVDKEEWGMTPPTLNAYYHPLRNQMVFPAGILQDPAFHRDQPAAMNFGAIGMVMGHELTHGFDDSGRKFDGHGTLTEWWEPDVAARFEERAQCVDDLYASYEVQPGVALNGRLTLGENIADLGGIKQAFNALKTYEATHGADEPIVEGLTNEQLFFVSYAQVWCAKVTEEMERMQVKADAHSPPKFRVIGPLSNFGGFAEAFRCEPGTPMNPETKCEVW